MMYSQDEQVPVPRSRVFVLDDGMFVVQWEENRVQGLLSGRYYIYSDERFGNAITDYELNQLQQAGAVASYDDELVYLAAEVNTLNQQFTRTFYLNTTLPKARMKSVESALNSAGLDERLSVRVQEIFVIVRGPAGVPFPTFDDAERTRELLVEYDADLFGQTVVAFVEINQSV